MKYAFILGKNNELSIAEIVSYLSAKEIKFSILEFAQEFAVLEIDDYSKIKIDDLGGSLKIASVEEAEINELDYSVFFSKSKFDFGVSVYGSSYKQFKAISLMVKKKLKEKGIKGNYFHISQPRTSTTHVEVINRKFLETADLVFCFGKKVYAGKTLQVHNPFDFQKRDVFKAYQRPMLSIPPRLSKIMINFLGIRSGVLLDPFCGFGSILQEAALSGFDVRGLDIDKKCVEACIKNLEWLQNEYNVEIPVTGRKIIHGTARKLSNYFEKSSIDGIVAEPYLGPPLKVKPDNLKAKKILEELRPMYESFFREAYKVLKAGGRVCIVSPRFKTHSGTFGLSISKLGEKCGLRSVDILKHHKIQHNIPLLDFEERHKLIREINILEKL